jgi:hypothetical protein
MVPFSSTMGQSWPKDMAEMRFRPGVWGAGGGLGSLRERFLGVGVVDYSRLAWQVRGLGGKRGRTNRREARP